jgi:stage II sporulation protein D
MSVREGDKLKNVAYFPSAPAPMPTDVQIGKYLRLPAVGFFLVADKSSDLHKASFSYNNKFYRGCLCLVSVDKQPSFSLVNYLDLEDYLLSVVPAEMPSSWPLEALKAQAVAARSYAIANSGKHGKDGYDVKDTTEDQVYLGVKSESKNSSQAVFESKDLVATYSGKPICAYFHSTSGGATELAENVWSKQLPYLKSVIGQDQLSPHFSWNKQFSVDELENNLVPDLGKLLSILIIARTPTQRATYVLFTGSSSARILPAETIRRTLNLPSTNFNVTYCDQGYAFAGHGFGHGLGLSQWGAKALAEQGYNAEQILKYYYKDINVERLADVCHY